MHDDQNDQNPNQTSYEHTNAPTDDQPRTNAPPDEGPGVNATAVDPPLEDDDVCDPGASLAELSQLARDTGDDGQPVSDLKRRLSDLFHPRHVTGLAACDRTEVEAAVARLAARKGLGELARELRGAVNRRRDEVEDLRRKLNRTLQGRQASVLVCDALRDLLGDRRLPDLEVPVPYMLTPTAIKMVLPGGFEGPTERVVARTPFLVTGRIRDLDGGPESVVLELPADRGGWRRVVVTLDVALDGRKVHEPLTRAGANFTAADAGAVASYLSAFLDVNEDAIPRSMGSTRTGWVGGGRLGFLAGRHLIPREGAAPDLDGDPFTWGADHVQLAGLEGGAAEVLHAIAPRGTLRGWLHAVGPVLSQPMVGAFIGASLATALLEPFDARNFIVDIHNPTSTGKTTTAEVAASVWGNPSTCPDTATGASGFVHTWDATAVGIERKASMLRAIPLVLDDTKNALAHKRGDLVSGAIYMVANGRGRARGTRDGALREVGSIRTVALSTGESPAVGFTNDAGARARVIELGGAPFAPHDPRVPAVSIAIAEQYGTAGPAFVRWLLDNADEWPVFGSTYRDRVETLRAELPAGNVGSRLAESAALILYTLELAREAIGLRVDVDGVRALLLEALAGGQQDADQAREALDGVHARAVANRSGFWVSTGGNGTPVGGWLGTWTNDGVGILTDVLRKWLTEAGHHPNDVLAQWKARGWLVCRDDGRLTSRVSMGDSRPRVYLVTFPADSEA